MICIFIIIYTFFQNKCFYQFIYLFLFFNKYFIMLSFLSTQIILFLKVLNLSVLPLYTFIIMV